MTYKCWRARLKTQGRSMSLKEIVKKEYVENDTTLCFKTTPITKIFILSIVTFGVYDFILLWNYWKTLKNNFGYKVSPFWRSFWCYFTNFKLFSIFAKYFETFNVKLWSPGWLAMLYLTLGSVANRISSRITKSGNHNWSLGITSLVLTIFATLILVLIQKKINNINERYYHNAPKNSWKVSNTIWTIIFLICWSHCITVLVEP